MTNSKEIAFGYKYNILLCLMNIYVYTTSKDFLLISILDLNYVILKLYIYIITFINTYDHHIYSNFIIYSKENKSINELLTYNIYDYLLSCIIPIITYDYTMIFHHIITIFILSIGKRKKNLHHIILLTLLLFSIPSPILLFARVFHKYNYKIPSIIFYMIFMITFFIFRILYTSCLLKKTLNYKNITQYYYTGNSLLLSIYFLQIYWMYKIILVLFNNI